MFFAALPLPAQRSETFSTAADDQESVKISVYLGESSIAKNNLLIANFVLEEIPKSKHGEPKIKVTFIVDTSCKVTGIAKIGESGNNLKIEAKETQISLTLEKVDQLLQQANFK